MKVNLPLRYRHTLFLVQKELSYSSHDCVQLNLVSQGGSRSDGDLANQKNVSVVKLNLYALCF